MKTTLPTILLIAGLSVFGACVTVKLDPAAENVRVTGNPETVSGCEFIGEVQGNDPYRFNQGISPRKAEENTFRMLRNEAAEVGANVVLITTASDDGTRARGEAYRCPQATGE